MWAIFFLLILLCLVVLYLPGHLITCVCSISRFGGLVMAPVLSIFSYVTIGIVLYALQIPTPAYMLFFITMVISVCLFLCLHFFKKGKVQEKGLSLLAIGSNDVWKQALIYIGVAVIITGFVFIWPLDGPGSFSRNDDTTFHLAVIRGFLDTGYYSTLNVGAYLNLGLGGSFYPAAWHVFVSIIASFVDGNVPLASNAAIVAFIDFVFPLTVLLLLHIVFPGRRDVINMGALFPAAFCAFPWGFIAFGQLLPNMISFMFVLMAFVLLVESFEARSATARAELLVFLVFALLGIVFAQTNGVFTFGILAVLYGIWHIVFLDSTPKPTVSFARAGAATILLGIACGVWALFYKAPFMSGVVTANYYGPDYSVPEAIFYGLNFMFSDRQGIQPFLAIVVFLGIVQTVKQPRYFWLSLTFIVCLAMAIMDMSCNSMVKYIITGFWYTDPNRTGAMAILLAIPLAALGASWLIEFGQKILEKYWKSKFNTRQLQKVSAALLLCIFVTSSIAPFHLYLSEKRDIRNGLAAINWQVFNRHAWTVGLTEEENSFMKKCVDIAGEDALFVNVPRDGSCWAYGASGINVYFRRSNNVGAGGKEDSEILRMHLKEVSSSNEAQRVLNKWDIHYLLILDDLSSGHPTRTGFNYREEDWVGIETITEETPGFNLRLSEDDMRFYEIDYNS